MRQPSVGMSKQRFPPEFHPYPPHSIPTLNPFPSPPLPPQSTPSLWGGFSFSDCAFIQILTRCVQGRGQLNKECFLWHGV